jgi:hypothetical protein
MGLRTKEARNFVREHDREGSRLTRRLLEALYTYEGQLRRFPKGW